MINRSINFILRRSKSLARKTLFFFINCESEDRTSEKLYKTLLKLKHPFVVYKLCLISESFQLNNVIANKSIKRSVEKMRGIPVFIQLTHFIKTELKHLLSRPKKTLKLREKIFRRVTKEATIGSAGVFCGLSHRHISSASKDDRFIQANGRFQNQYSSQINKEANTYLNNLRSIPTEHDLKYRSTKVGVLISCFYPEKYVQGFLDNLCSLTGKDRIVPVFINAGMEQWTESLIKEKVEQSFSDYHFVTKKQCKIYEAWNIGINTLNDSVDYLTNFNVDDRRHPDCLEIQSTYLDKFERANVAVTDYIYYFAFMNSINEMYDLNDGYHTNIPVINDRTLVYKNFPHSGPMWRRLLHNDPNIGLFDESYVSAGDAEFWYRVSRQYPNSFDTIAMPLSLYFQNPEGISTRPNTRGMEEHKRCTKEQYSFLKEQINKNINPQFSKDHLKICDPHNLSIHAAQSFLLNS